MRICIPTETNEGEKAKVYGHFGSTPYFTIYDIEKDSFEVIDNSHQHHAPGTCHPMGELNGKCIDAVVCGGMGARAGPKLNEAGVKTYTTSVGTVKETVRNFRQDKLEEITPVNACCCH